MTGAGWYPKLIMPKSLIFHRLLETRTDPLADGTLWVAAQGVVIISRHVGWIRQENSAMKDNNKRGQEGEQGTASESQGSGRARGNAANLSHEARVKGGQRSAQVQVRDERGQFAGRTGGERTSVKRSQSGATEGSQGASGGSASDRGGGNDQSVRSDQ
jgi:hypothetical protein